MIQLSLDTVSGHGRSIGEHGKAETLTGQDGMREIDGFLIDPIGSETEDIGDKTCATDESELSMVHEGSDSSVRIEQGNIMIDFILVCIARSMVDRETGSLELDGAKRYYIDATDCALECS